MAYNFNDGRGDAPADAPREPEAAAPAGSTSPAGAPAAASSPAATPSPAYARFNSCRWQQPAEDGNAAFCTHREVKPYAGTTGFDPEAWCPDCQYYKLRRTPKKRAPQDEYSY